MLRKVVRLPTGGRVLVLKCTDNFGGTRNFTCEIR